jgi:TfoX/Sxy family transcriptional regulator of competence genes
MPYNEQLANRVREILSETETDIEEKKMFSGLCFMVNGKMCVGVNAGNLMVRFDPALHDNVMEKEGAAPMDFTTKIMRGYVFVDIAVLNTRKKLDYWVQLALTYNPIAKASKKKK